MEKDNSKEIFEQDLHEHFAFDIDVGQEPLRIDKFLMNRIENATRNKIQKAAKEGSIRVNGIIVKSSYKVKKGDKISIDNDEELKEKKGIEIGHIFQLGQKYSEKLNAKFSDKDGQLKNLWMGCYGIGVTRIAQAAI